MTAADATRHVGVTGAAGFIGRHLVEHLAARGWEVRAFQRATGPAPGPSVTVRRFEMPDALDERDLQGLDVVVHGAVQEYGPGHRDADQVNREGTRRLIGLARGQGVRLVYFSSLSAHPGAESHYGRNKLELEALFDPSRDCVLRLGLVLGNGGLFGSMVELIRRSRVVPLAGGGRQPIQTLWMEDLLAIVERVIERGTSGRFDLATPEIYTMRELYQTVIRGLGLRRRLVPVPLGLVHVGVTVLETLRVPFGIQRENVLGLKRLRAFDTAPDLRALGVVLLPMPESVARLLARG